MYNTKSCYTLSLACQQTLYCTHFKCGISLTLVVISEASGTNFSTTSRTHQKSRRSRKILFFAKSMKTFQYVCMCKSKSCYFNIYITFSQWSFYARPNLSHRKFPKYSDTQKICCNHSKIWTMWLYHCTIMSHRVMSPNDADEMANSGDPDQTAPFAQAYLSENLGSLRYIKQ